jgi:hypothetical protein
MNGLIQFDPTDLDWQVVSARLAFTLLHFLWQGAVVWLLVLIVLRCLAKSPASTRYVVSYSALASLPLIAIATFLTCRLPTELGQQYLANSVADSQSQSQERTTASTQIARAGAENTCEAASQSRSHRSRHSPAR